MPAVAQRLLASWLTSMLTQIADVAPEHQGLCSMPGFTPSGGATDACLQLLEDAAQALAAASGALSLLPQAAAACERQLPRSSHERPEGGAAPAAGGDPRPRADAAAALAAAAQLALVTRVLQLRPKLLHTALEEWQLLQVLRRLLLEHSGQSNTESCGVTAGCCGALMSAAADCADEDVPALLQGAAPLVSGQAWDCCVRLPRAGRRRTPLKSRGLLEQTAWTAESLSAAFVNTPPPRILYCML
jgi:hypothetical protein